MPRKKKVPGPVWAAVERATPLLPPQILERKKRKEKKKKRFQIT